MTIPKLSRFFTRFAKSRIKPTDETPQFTIHQRRALALPGAALALDPSLVDQMQTDAMVQTALTVKRLAVVAAPWQVVPADASPAAQARAAFVTDNFRLMQGSPINILNQAMDAFAHGWSIQELVYELRGDHIGLRAVKAKDARYFGQEFDAYGNLTHLTLQLPGEEKLSLPPDRFVIMRNRQSPLHSQGQSDLLAAQPHWQAKRQLLSAWKLHLEKFAMPTVLGKYQRGLPPEEQSAILRALQDLQNNTAIVYPSEIDIDTLGGQKEPSTGFMEAIEFHNREIARAILGQTLTTDEGRRVGSLALGKVHLQVLLLQINAIRRELADVVMTEQVIRPLVELNFGPGLVPRFEFETAQLDVFASGRLE